VKKLTIKQAESRLDKYCNDRFTEEQEWNTNLYTDNSVTYRTEKLFIRIDLTTGKITER